MFSANELRRILHRTQEVARQAANRHSHGRFAAAEDEAAVDRFLDVMRALTLVEVDDPSYPWERGVMLAQLQRYREAACAFMEAAPRFASLADKGEGIAHDEEEWAKTSLYHAAKNLALAGDHLSVSQLVPRLAPDDQVELRDMIRARSTGEE